MWVATIDDTGVSFRSLSELARFLGCARSNINWYMNHTKKKNHFYYQDIRITIKKHKLDMERHRARSREYYQTHKAQQLATIKLWRAKNKDKVDGYREKWRIEHKEWFNAYYREQRRKRKENENI